MADNHLNEAERTQDEADALADLRKAVQAGASDDWLLGFIRGYPFAHRTPVSAPNAGGERQSIDTPEFRRLPRCYGRPPNIEAPIAALARQAGFEMNFIRESFAERGAVAPAPGNTQEPD